MNQVKMRLEINTLVALTIAMTAAGASLGATSKGTAQALSAETPMLEKPAKTTPSTDANIKSRTKAQNQIPPENQIQQNESRPENQVTQSRQPLIGGVEEKSNISAESVPTGRSNAALDAVLTPQQATADTRVNAFRVLAQKLKAGIELNSDDYRALNIGCTGFDYIRTYFQPIATVTAVYPGSPADKAGIKVGDKAIEQKIDDSYVTNPDVPTVGVDLARAGSNVDFVLYRNHRTEKITLTRINIEDLQDAHARQLWERVARSVGLNAPDGTYIGSSIDTLQQRENADALEKLIDGDN